jgi:hypothetical protein
MIFYNNLNNLIIILKFICHQIIIQTNQKIIIDFLERITIILMFI